MRHWILPALAVGAILWAMTGLASAQSAPPCGPTEAMSNALTEKYGEAPVFQGMSGGALIHIWLNPETGTWTATRSDPRGISCLLADGQHGEAMEPQPTGEAM